MCVYPPRARQRRANVPSCHRTSAPPPSTRKTPRRESFQRRDVAARALFVFKQSASQTILACSSNLAEATRRPTTGRRSHRRAKKTRLKTHALFFSRANCSFVTRRRHLSREECHRRDTAFRLPWEHRTRRKPDGYAISFSSPRVLTGPEPRDGHHPRSALRVDALRRSGSPRADPDPSPRSRRRRDARGQSYAARFYRPI